MTEELESIVVLVGGLPQIIPGELAPEAIYSERGLGSLQERISYWETRYAEDHDLPKPPFKSQAHQLDCLEGYYLGRIIFDHPDDGEEFY